MIIYQKGEEYKKKTLFIGKFIVLNYLFKKKFENNSPLSLNFI